MGQRSQPWTVDAVATRRAELGESLAAQPAAIAAFAFLCVLGPALFSQPKEIGDPVEYYQAARCAAERMFCAPHDHWSARWPVFMPTGWLYRLNGETRFTMGLFPHLQALAAVILFTTLLKRCWGSSVALVGGLLFATTPLVSQLALQLNADMLELVFLLGGMLAIVSARIDGKIELLPLGGALFALAVETRTTALAPCAAIGASLLYLRWPVRTLFAIAGGAVAMLAVSSAAQLLVTGDPFANIRFALAHTQIPTTQLPPGTDTSGSPFFNLELIRNWNRPVSVHWTIDPLLGMSVNEPAGVLVSATGAVLLIGWRAFRGAGSEARDLRVLLLAACATFATICFALSIHPTPRMFLPVIAAVTAAAAVLVDRSRRDLRPLLLLGVAPVLALQSFTTRMLNDDPVRVERLADAWSNQLPRGVATNVMTWRHLHASPAIRALPIREEGSGPYLILAPWRCDNSPYRRRGWAVSRAAQIPRKNDTFHNALAGAVGFNVPKAPPWSLCLYDRG